MTACNRNVSFQPIADIHSPVQTALIAPRNASAKTHRILKGLISGTAFLGLSSCSLAYDIEILVSNGEIVFIPHELGLFGRRLEEPVKVERIIVEQMDRKPLPVWEIASHDMNGMELSRVTYGRLPARFSEKTAAQKLEAGRLYVVELFALGGAGSQYFVMSPYSGYQDDPKVKFLAPLEEN